jgi:predicted aldo/keto reductase-like oxidoreductase
MNFAYREKGVEEAARRKMGVVVMNPLGGGIIPQHPERFSFLKEKPQDTIVEAALRFLINDPRITVSLVGIANVAQLKEALSAVEGFKKHSEERVGQLRKELSASMNSLCTNCGYCAGCPQDVPITKLMDGYNHYELAGKKERALADRLRWHWDIGLDNECFDLCSDCGRCEELCTQKLPITNRLKEIRRIIRKLRDEAPAK